ncbi:hypothetical protein ATL39_3064 [Sinobaca qinghaiensis]|uniref:Uncharacterized protein n=1 Tax=Sinobaca qinghaiensis TaxID=342944 RepID=A0A419UWY4_9BACL|nr:hypothetical protein [Sinobaca qinghaiensis]RKD69639.1 hypothetical protein ATL39_3064 [Sinobaca qinghaiensis]
MSSKLYEILFLIAGIMILVTQIGSHDGRWWVIVLAIFIIVVTIFRLARLSNKKEKKKTAPR